MLSAPVSAQDIGVDVGWIYCCFGATGGGKQIELSLIVADVLVNKVIKGECLLLLLYDWIMSFSRAP
jgi:hypothetical protein